MVVISGCDERSVEAHWLGPNGARVFQLRHVIARQNTHPACSDRRTGKTNPMVSPHTVAHLPPSCWKPPPLGPYRPHHSARLHSNTSTRPSGDTQPLNPSPEHPPTWSDRQAPTRPPTGPTRLLQYYPAPRPHITHSPALIREYNVLTPPLTHPPSPLQAIHAARTLRRAHHLVPPSPRCHPCSP